MNKPEVRDGRERRSGAVGVRDADRGDAVSRRGPRIRYRGHAVCISVDMPPGVHVEAHEHADEDQLNIVISGRVGTRVGGNGAILEAGGMRLMPRGVQHELWNAGPETARLIEIYTPPGMEERFARGGQRGLTTALTNESTHAQRRRRDGGQADLRPPSARMAGVDVHSSFFEGRSGSWASGGRVAASVR